MKRILFTVMLALIALMATGCNQSIPPANVGIRFNGMTGIQTAIVKPRVIWVGLHEQLILYPTSIHNATYVRSKTEGEQKKDDSIRVSTLEGSILPIDISVAYHVEPENVVRCFQTFGSADLDQIQREYIRWVTNYGANAVAGKSSVFNLISSERALFGPRIKKVISPILLQFGITVDDVYIREVYTEEYAKKIKQRLNYKTNLETSKVKLKQASIDAKTMLTDAARQAAEYHLMASQGTQAIEFKRVELQQAAIEKWDGIAPIVGDSRIPFTNLKVNR